MCFFSVLRRVNSKCWSSCSVLLRFPQDLRSAERCFLYSVYVWCLFCCCGEGGEVCCSVRENGERFACLGSLGGERLGAANIKEDRWNRAAVEHIPLNMRHLQCTNTRRHILMLAVTNTLCLVVSCVFLTFGLYMPHICGDISLLTWSRRRSQQIPRTEFDYLSEIASDHQEQFFSTWMPVTLIIQQQMSPIHDWWA